MHRFYLPNRLKDEKIILLLRRHPFIIFLKILLWVVVAVLPLIFYFILGETIQGFFNHDLFGPLIVVFTSILYLYVWLFAFTSWVDYYLDVWIVTNERIINIEQKALFSRTVSEQKLYRVQDVTAELKGFFPTFLNYGDVQIQTAGEQQHFIFKQVPNPNEVAKKITQLAEQNKKLHHLIDAPLAGQHSAE
ncbi:MAG TPA: PH domain-containing protein [Patescibacteria group bacterium]|nr:PH domain-containing protein [Patescibacteria group bacterium]